MATETFTKYNMMKVGDRIAFPKSISLIKGGVIATIKGLNGHAKVITTTNGGRFIVSKYAPNDYDVYRDRNHIPTA